MTQDISNFLKLPTDNLYKFISLFGLILIIFPLIFIIYLLYNIESNIFSIGENTYTNVIEREYLYTELELDGFLFDRESNVKDIRDIVIAQAGEEEQKELLKKFKEVDLGFAKYQYLFDKAEVLDNIVSRALMTQLITSFFGVFVMGLGFKLWYERHQKYLDEALKNKSKSM